MPQVLFGFGAANRALLDHRCAEPERTECIALLVAPEALIGVRPAQEKAASICVYQETRDGAVATNRSVRLAAPPRSSTPTSFDLVGLDDSTRPAVAAAAKFRALTHELESGSRSRS